MSCLTCRQVYEFLAGGFSSAALKIDRKNCSCGGDVVKTKCADVFRKINCCVHRASFSIKQQHCSFTAAQQTSKM